MRTKQAAKKLILIGAGMVGMRFIENSLKISPDKYDIQVFNKEPTAGYNRIMLSPVLAGEKSIPDIITHDKAWFIEHGVELFDNTEITMVNKKKQIVTTATGKNYSYDVLVVATGSAAFILPVDGTHLPSVVTFRDINDVDLMLAAAKEKHKAIVIGGGLLGLEAANGLMAQGMDVTVVHASDILMNVQMDAVAGNLLQKSLQANGMKFVMSARTTAILGDTDVTGVGFADGTELATDLVVMAVGIRPSVALAKKIGLEVNNAIIVNDQLETSADSIYALGECVEHRGQLYGLVAPLFEQAEVLAQHLADKPAAYQGSFISTKLKVTGISLFSAGEFQDSKATESLVYEDLTHGIYRKVVLKDNKIQGAIMFGDVSGSNWIFDNLISQEDMSSYRDTLVFGEGF